MGNKKEKQRMQYKPTNEKQTQINEKTEIRSHS